MIDFTEIKNRVSMEEAARWLGFTPNRAGFIRCPFHSEKTGSLKLYRERFQCFGCGASGDAVDFTAQVLGISTGQAAKKLIDAFAVPEAVRALKLPNSDAKTRRAQLLGFWKAAAYDEICVSSRLSLRAMNSDDPELQALGRRRLKRIELVTDEFLERSAAELFEIYGHGPGREELDGIIRIGQRYAGLSDACGRNNLDELTTYISKIMA